MLKLGWWRGEGREGQPRQWALALRHRRHRHRHTSLATFLLLRFGFGAASWVQLLLLLCEELLLPSGRRRTGRRRCAFCGRSLLVVALTVLIILLLLGLVRHGCIPHRRIAPRIHLRPKRIHSGSGSTRLHKDDVVDVATLQSTVRLEHSVLLVRQRGKVQLTTERRHNLRVEMDTGWGLRGSRAVGDMAARPILQNQLGSRVEVGNTSSA
mmetsp:Transcript_61680/g.145798  ORF Transcript_61680/g.145798 Transcript_61680/m.145798 type:complete len:211 (-) Transcript_61680:686-1318(-)